MGETCFVRIHQNRASFVDNALYIRHPDIFQRQAQINHEIQARKRRGTCPRYNNLDLVDILANDFQAIDKGRRNANRSAVLIIVKNRDAHALTQLALNRKALRRLDVFEIDAAKSWFQTRDNLNELVRILLIDFNIKNIDSRKLFKQYRFAFHNGFGSQRPDIAKPQDRGAIGDHANEIASRRVAKSICRIGNNLLARRRNTWRISQCQITLIGQHLGRRNRNFPGATLLMIIKSGLAKSFFHI